MDNELLQAISQLMDKKFKEELEPIREELKPIKEDLAFVKDRVIVIENEHGDKLAALADGYSLFDEKLNDTNASVKRLEAKIDDISLTVGVHDVKLDKLAK